MTDWDTVAELEAESRADRKAQRAEDNQTFVRDLLADHEPYWAALLDMATAGLAPHAAGYMVRVYGDDPQAGPGALLEEAGFTSGLDAVRYIAGAAGQGLRAELLARAGDDAPY
jgi:hypothetical protein